MVPKPIILCALLAFTIALSAVGTAFCESQSTAASATDNDANLFDPKLLVNLRPRSKAELVDLRPQGSFVRIRSTSAPAYDPAFRSQDDLARQARRAPIAAQNDRVKQPPRTTSASNIPIADERPTLVSLIQRLSPLWPKPTKVMDPADK